MNKLGFTLVEILIVIVIISTLAGIVFVAVNPADRFADTSQRFLLETKLFSK
jgi:prepilin-type N-terminal cleavage/methylation domain-containing protein